MSTASVPARAGMSAADVELLESALLAHGWAPGLCQHDARTESCAWYHGAWQTLRMLGLMSTSGVNAAHYAAELARSRHDPSFRRVLVTGSADYAMLKLIADSRDPSDAPLTYVVLDRCATPLRICEWYAQRHGLHLETLHQDVLDPLPEAAFDAVYTHAFMGNFDADDRQRLVRQWARVLRPGGRVVTVQRVRDDYPGDIVSFSDAEAEAFVARVAELAPALLPPAAAGLDVVAMAREHARRFRALPVRSADRLRGLFEDARFRLDRFERSAPDGPAGVTGPSVPNTAGHYLITAERLAAE
ncbi:class I SAM-dependent methyltransferase [Emcibacter sp. SYSU 3D8]|uniref:class I SAM-dependent methyltransferase n=1 Tax=Emcibacter sp. SYSU 3D8 TaxID=3133969 RepID=UPI0031FF4727